MTQTMKVRTRKSPDIADLLKMRQDNLWRKINKENQPLKKTRMNRHDILGTKTKGAKK